MTLPDPTTIESQHDGAESIGVSSARGLLWEISEEIDGAWKDANGLHLPGDGDAHIRIVDVSGPSRFGYKFAVRVQQDTYGKHHDVLTTRGNFDPAELKRAVAEAIEWLNR